MPATGTLMLVAVIALISFLVGRYVFPEAEHTPEATGGEPGRAADGDRTGERSGAPR